MLVSSIGCIRFYRLGLLTWRSAYPFAVLGLPFSVVGGALHLPLSAYSGRRIAAGREGADGAPLTDTSPGSATSGAKGCPPVNLDPADAHTCAFSNQTQSFLRFQAMSVNA
jgi:hypothetical protein